MAIVYFIDEFIMKFFSLKIAATLLFSLAALMFGAPQNAQACSPPLDGIQPQHELEFPQSIPINGAWAFQASVLNASIEDLSVEVQDENGAPVAGQISEVVLWSSADSSTRLFIWTPTELLEPEHLYSVTVRSTSDSANDYNTWLIDEVFSLKTTAGELIDPPVASLIREPTLRVDEQEGGVECCTDSDFCNSCGSCERCWNTEYVYLPTIDIGVKLPETDTHLQTYTRVTSGQKSTYYWNQSTRTIERSLFFEEGESGPFCVSIETYLLATQELLDARETCFNEDELPEYTERELQGVTRPDTCEEQPDAGGETDVTEEPDAGGETDVTEGPDASTPPAIGMDADTGCGCRAAPLTPGSLLGMLLFLGVFGTARVRRFLRD